MQKKTEKIKGENIYVKKTVFFRLMTLPLIVKKKTPS